MSILPTGPRGPNVKLSTKTILVYAKPGVGKTHLAACFPHVLFIPTEPGTEELTVAATDEVTTWQAFLQYVDALAAEDHPYETVAVDVVDRLYAMCHDHVCRLNSWDDVDDGKHGRGWRKVKDEWERGMTRLRSIKRKDGRPMCVVLLSHERADTLMSDGPRPRDTGFKRITSAMPGAGRSILHGMVQHIWRLEVAPGGARILRTRPIEEDSGDRIEAKSRGPQGRALPATINIGKEGEGFRKLATAWARAFAPKDAPGWVPPKPKKTNPNTSGSTAAKEE